MPTAYTHPCCPNRVAISKNFAKRALLACGLFWIATATASVSGKELDYRLYGPTPRVQPRVVADAGATPPTFLAALQRPKLSKLSKEKKAAIENRSAKPDAQPEEQQDELLIVPPPTAETTPSEDTPPEDIAIPDKDEEEAEEQRNCYQAPALASLSTSIALPAGKLPTNAAALCAAQTPPNGDARLACAWGVTEQHWAPTCLCHRPLYFEEINAERYGYTPSYLFQPVISAVRFFATVPALPYKMAVQCPRDCIYTLGHYRPGSCVPWRNSRLPLRLKGIAAETSMIAGLILLIP